MRQQCVRRVLLAAAVLIGMGSGACAEPNGMVVLLTDYGTDSIYVGILKGAIYTKWPQARVETLTNSVPSFDIEAGGALLAEACREWPAGTTFCCVVDPGVGTDRRAVALETGAGQFFVAPDNGLLTAVMARDGVQQAREATNRQYWREGVVSSTFHGRDVFGPVSASVAQGTPLRKLGSPAKDLVTLAIPAPGVKGSEALGRVRRIDPYGNVVTDITEAMLAELGVELGDRLAVSIGDYAYEAPFEKTYASVPEGEVLVLLQSTGVMECAVNLGSLAALSGATFHAQVRIRRIEPPLALLEVGGETPFKLVVYANRSGTLDVRGVHRAFMLDPARLTAIEKAIPDPKSVDLGPGRFSPDNPDSRGTSLSLGFARHVFGFDKVEAVPEALRPLHEALRRLYADQVSELARPVSGAAR